MRRTALTVAEDAFRLLVCQPAPLAFDGRAHEVITDANAVIRVLEEDR